MRAERFYPRHRLLVVLLILAGQSAPAPAMFRCWLFGGLAKPSQESRAAYQDLMAHLNPMNVAPYAGAANVLFLADQGVSLAEFVARKFKQANVVKTDIEYEGTSRTDNLTTQHLDNTKDFPFADNAFDKIVMRSGLCRCRGAICCGGISPAPKDVSKFLVEVGRVLNKNNPASVAYLEGAARNEGALATWEEAAALARTERPGLNFLVVRNEAGEFAGVRITPAR